MFLYPKYDWYLKSRYIMRSIFWCPVFLYIFNPVRYNKRKLDGRIRTAKRHLFQPQKLLLESTQGRRFQGCSSLYPPLTTIPLDTYQFLNTIYKWAEFSTLKRLLLCDCSRFRKMLNFYWKTCQFYQLLRISRALQWMQLEQQIRKHLLCRGLPRINFFYDELGFVQ